jgi:hypothetical protein
MGKQELDRLRSSMVNIKIGGRVIPAVRSNRCKVCIHPARALIEERLLMNDTYPSIVEWVSSREHEEIDGAIVYWPPLTVPQLLNHYRNGHCPVDTQVLHELSEQRMAELGASYEASVGRIVDQVVITKLVAAKGQELIATGQISPGVSETLAAAKMLHEMERDRQVEDVGLGAYAAAMEQYFTTVQRIVTPQQWAMIGAALSSNPILKELTARMTPEEDIQDAELVET